MMSVGSRRVIVDLQIYAHRQDKPSLAGMFGKLWLPSLKYDLVCPTSSLLSIRVATHRPCQQGQSPQRVHQKRRPGRQIPDRIGDELGAAPWNMQQKTHV